MKVLRVKVPKGTYMISLIEVICPHCGARGQITVPPIGAIVIGPCPQCEELVVVFCGKVLPLDKETMLYGTPEQKREHLMSVLSGFLEEKLAQISFDFSAEDGDLEGARSAELDHEDPVAEVHDPEPPRHGPEPKVITPGEIEYFVREELDLLDNKDYFKAVFG